VSSNSISEVSPYDYIKYFILIFLYIFGPVLNKYGPFFDFIFFISILVVIYNLNLIKTLNATAFNFFYLIVILFIFLSFRILFYPKLSLALFFSNALKPFRILITLWAGFFIAKSLKKKNFTFGDLLSLVYVSILVHSIIMIYQFFDRDFRDYLYSYTTIGEFRSTFEYDFRMGGLSGGSGGAVLSVVQSLGIIIIPFLFKIQKSVLKRALILVSSGVILFSIIVCGRSGIYNVIFMLPLSIFILHKFTKSLKYISLGFLLVITIFKFSSETILSGEQTDLYYSFSRTFDSFIQLQESGKYENNTVSSIKGYFLLPDLFTFFIGDNDALLNYDMERNLDSDIGYVRNLFSFGFFGLLAYLLPFLFLLYQSILNFRRSIVNQFLFIVLFIMLVFHFKESYLYARMFWSIICLFVGFLLLQKEKELL
jgi:hypothetical protein